MNDSLHQFFTAVNSAAPVIIFIIISLLHTTIIG